MKMKFYLAMAAAAFLMTNCSQDENLIQTKGSTNTLTAAIEGATRSSVTDGGVFSWNENDAIAVGNQNGGFTKFVCGTEGSFSAETSIVPTSYAIYPYNEAYTSLPEGLPTITLASNYEYGSTNAPMLATITEGATSLTFNHLAGLMRFKVKNVPTGATTFTLTADKGITGEFTPTTTNGETSISALTAGNDNQSVSITFNEAEEVMDFYIPMPVGEYESLTVSITGSNLSGYTLTSTQGVTNTITRGKLLLMPTLVCDDNGGLTKEEGSIVSLNANEEVSLEVNNGDEVVVDVQDNAEAILNLTAPDGTTDGTLTISDGSAEGTGSATSTGTLNVKADNVSTLIINAPTLTVNLASGTYDKVEALTATNTLIIGEEVTIGELVIKGGNVKLKGDLALTTPLVIDVETTIDLNGYTIKPSGTSMTKTLSTADALILIRRGGNLTITDSSTSGNGRIDTGNNESIMGAIKMTDGQDTGDNTATLTINGGTIKGYYYGIMGNGNRNGTAITIGGGTIEAGYCANDNTGIFHPQVGTLTISGGSITGYMSAVEMRSGTLTISDGTFESTGSPADAAANGNGNTIKGAAIAISQHTTNQELKVTVNGGTFKGVYALYEEDKQDENVSGISMSVTGGIFNGSIFTENCPQAITGGTFSDPSACYYLGTNANVTVNMEEDYEGAGFKTTNGQTIALTIASGKTYTVTAPLVGSAGTQNLGFQFLQGSTVTISGGTITSADAKMLINNYADLTLKGVTLAPDIPNTMNGQTYYVLSNNCGTVNIEGGTTITAPTSSDTSNCPTVYAFDVCKYASYPNVTVNVKDATITGNVEYTGAGIDQKLNISGGTITGNLVVADAYKTGALAGGVSITAGTQTGDNWSTYEAIDSAKIVGKWTDNIHRTYTFDADGTFDSPEYDGVEFLDEKWYLLGRILILEQTADEDDPEGCYITSITDTEIKGYPIYYIEGVCTISFEDGESTYLTRITE